VAAVDSLSLVASPLPGSHWNESVVRSIYRAFSGLAKTGDIGSYVAGNFHSECEYRPIEERGAIRGHAALGSWIRRWLDAWDDAWDEVDEIIEVGQTVFTAIRVHGRGRRSGMEVSQRLFDVFELREGRVVRVREYLDADEALKAAGLLGLLRAA